MSEKFPYGYDLNAYIDKAFGRNGNDCEVWVWKGKNRIDQKNGFLVYEHKYVEHLGKIEMCYWNEADGKHKLFACNRWSFENGKPMMGQYDVLCFYRYDNATKKMIISAF